MSGEELQKNAAKKRIVYAVLTVIWCVTIFMFSAQGGDESAESSDGVVEIISEVITPILPEMDEPQRVECIDDMTFFIRKGAHFSLYFILAVFSLEFFRTLKISKKPFAAYLAAWCFCTFYAATDEFHQLFVEGRSGELTDVLIDSGGALFGLLVSFAVCKTAGKSKAKRSD